jgi:hypothetical protein
MSVTNTPTRPVVSTSEPTPEPHRSRLQLSATQLVASALAAVTATVAASYLGVSGTVIGAAVASVITVSGNAIYGHSLRRTGARVRTAVPIAARWVPESGSAPATAPLPVVTPTQRPRLRGWQRIGIASVGVFVALLAAVTTVELALGRPLSDALRGKQAQGTSLSNETGGNAAPKVTTRTITVTPSVRFTTPTVTQTAPAVTATATPTVTVTPSPSPTSASSTPVAPSSSTTPTP